jgi:dienelactone hydrolase
MRSIWFSVEGEPVAGHLHLPRSVSSGLPGVVVAGPMTSVKEQVTGVYATALAARGVAALAIDHRHFGASGGTPRQYERWDRKVDDLVVALDWLAAQPEISRDRIGLAAVCLGSGYAAYAAARSLLVRALGMVAGYFRDPEEMRRQDPKSFDARLAQGSAARDLFLATGEVQTIPAASLTGDAAMTSADTVDFRRRATRAFRKGLRQSACRSRRVGRGCRPRLPFPDGERLHDRCHAGRGRRPAMSAGAGTEIEE